jgi:YidC/Oxa1 family membrane protein insertase
MRHAPFWGWVHDLSAADPSSMLNLFGLIPFELPSFLVIGAWPLLYGLSMWAQQKFYPPAEDPVQRQMMAMFPWIFTYVFAHFPAGLVIYFTWSNLLGWAQNMYIKWHMHRGKN